MEIKKIALLSEKSRERKKQGLCVVEGAREIRLALQGGYSLENLLYQPDIFSERQLSELLGYTTQKLTPIAIGKEVYEKISYRSSTEGVIALVAVKKHGLDTLVFSTKKPLLLVAEAPEKPGNIGALLRTADAAHIDAVIIAIGIPSKLLNNTANNASSIVVTNITTVNNFLKLPTLILSSTGNILCQILLPICLYRGTS